MFSCKNMNRNGLKLAFVMFISFLQYRDTMLYQTVKFVAVIRNTQNVAAASQIPTSQ